MKGFIVNSEGHMVVGDSDAACQQEILLQSQGHNPFAPHIGVGLFHYQEAPQNTLELFLAPEIEINLQADGAHVNTVEVGGPNITIDAIWR